MKRSPIKRKTRLRPVSKRRSADMKLYSSLRKDFLAMYPLCYVYWQEVLLQSTGLSYECWSNMVREGGYENPCPASDIHHVHKRGKNYLDTTTWMSVSRKNHERIEQNKKWARACGYLANI
jgi:hypothetical protein